MAATARDPSTWSPLYAAMRDGILARRARLMAAGLCINCGKSRGKNGTARNCRRCADVQTERNYQRQLRIVAAGGCRSCGKPRGADGTGTGCRPCADRNKLRVVQRANEKERG